MINWFQIPVADIDRASTFYGHLLGVTVVRHADAWGEHAFLQGRDGLPRGELLRTGTHQPATGGVLLFLGAPDDGIDAALDRARESGGTVTMPATSLGPMGAIAMLLDSEGNRIALHANPR